MDWCIDIVNPVTKTWDKHLMLGYYPVIKTVSNSGVTDDKDAHVLATGKTYYFYNI